MMDRPDATTLLRAMARTLSEEVVSAIAGGPQHAARVVSNLCEILAREWAPGSQGEEGKEAVREAIGSLLGQPDVSGDWAAILDDRLRSSDEIFDAQVREILLADARRRLAINRPGYDS
jgi:Domain of unknown function (DUF6285)